MELSLGMNIPERVMGTRNSLFHLLLRPETKTMGGCLSPRKGRGPRGPARTWESIQEESPRVGNEPEWKSILRI